MPCSKPISGSADGAPRSRERRRRLRHRSGHPDRPVAHDRARPQLLHRRAERRRQVDASKGDLRAAAAAARAVVFEGADLAGLRTDEILHRGICFVPQDRSLFPDMTVTENMRMGGYILNDRRAVEKRIDEVFGMFPILRERSSQLAKDSVRRPAADAAARPRARASSAYHHARRAVARAGADRVEADFRFDEAS